MPEPQEIKSAAGQLVTHAAGYVAARTIDMGLRHGLFAALAASAGPVSAEDLAAGHGLDPLFTRVWLRSAHAAGVLERQGAGYLLDEAMAVALLDSDHGAHTGPLFSVLGMPELFDIFQERLGTGERLWWDDCSAEFIAAVSGTGRPFYNRLVPAGLGRVPGLESVLAGPCQVLELATGAGRGLVRMAQHYPQARFTGVDGDAHSLELAQDLVKQAGIDDRVELVCSTFEDFRRDAAFDAAVINISMHECRDMDRVAANVAASLRPGGIFAVSDFPFPADDDTEALRAPGGRVMCGIQFFEALIDDQLVPTSAFVDLLGSAGFEAVGSFDLSPVHAVTYGTRSPSRPS